ncbi:hypothetical protein GGR51DRAFT_523038 [Nemania sp. FL0031]|nr:hypothetical protein GGR51DRAFT_523038 [Nemania sp. FL0031]
MGLFDIWGPIGSTAIRPSARGHSGGDGAEGNPTGGLDPGVETGGSGHQASYTDMRWWVSASDYQVNIALLTKLAHICRKILIWEMKGSLLASATAT